MARRSHQKPRNNPTHKKSDPLKEANSARKSQLSTINAFDHQAHQQKMNLYYLFLLFFTHILPAFLLSQTDQPVNQLKTAFSDLILSDPEDLAQTTLEEYEKTRQIYTTLTQGFQWLTHDISQNILYKLHHEPEIRLLHDGPTRTLLNLPRELSATRVTKHALDYLFYHREHPELTDLFTQVMKQLNAPIKDFRAVSLTILSRYQQYQRIKGSESIMAFDPKLIYSLQFDPASDHPIALYTYLTHCYQLIRQTIAIVDQSTTELNKEHALKSAVKNNENLISIFQNQLPSIFILIMLTADKILRHVIKQRWKPTISAHVKKISFFQANEVIIKLVENSARNRVYQSFFSALEPLLKLLTFYFLAASIDTDVGPLYQPFSILLIILMGADFFHSIHELIQYQSPEKIRQNNTEKLASLLKIYGKQDTKSYEDPTTLCFTINTFDSEGVMIDSSLLAKILSRILNDYGITHDLETGTHQKIFISLSKPIPTQIFTKLQKNLSHTIRHHYEAKAIKTRLQELYKTNPIFDLFPAENQMRFSWRVDFLLKELDKEQLNGAAIHGFEVTVSPSIYFRISRVQIHIPNPLTDDAFSFLQTALRHGCAAPDPRHYSVTPNQPIRRKHHNKQPRLSATHGGGSKETQVQEDTTEQPTLVWGNGLTYPSPQDELPVYPIRSHSGSHHYVYCEGISADDFRSENDFKKFMTLLSDARFVRKKGQTGFKLVEITELARQQFHIKAKLLGANGTGQCRIWGELVQPEDGNRQNPPLFKLTTVVYKHH